jgi:hypothetical protein
VPASKVAGTDLGGVIVLDAAATLVTAHLSGLAHVRDPGTGCHVAKWLPIRRVVIFKVDLWFVR